MTSIQHAPHPSVCSRAWNKDVDSVLTALTVDLAVGLDTAQAISRRNEFGRNQLSPVKRRGSLRIVADQFRSVVILLLCAAGALAFLFSDPVEGVAILVVIGSPAARAASTCANGPTCIGWPLKRGALTHE